MLSYRNFGRPSCPHHTCKICLLYCRGGQTFLFSGQISIMFCTSGRKFDYNSNICRANFWAIYASNSEKNLVYNTVFQMTKTQRVAKISWRAAVTVWPCVVKKSTLICNMTEVLVWKRPWIGCRHFALKIDFFIVYWKYIRIGQNSKITSSMFWFYKKF